MPHVEGDPLAGYLSPEQASGYRQALETVVRICDEVARESPTNKNATDPRAAYRAGAATCAWRARELLKGIRP